MRLEVNAFYLNSDMQTVGSKITFGSSTKSIHVKSGMEITSTENAIAIRAENSNGNSYELMAANNNLMFRKISPSGEITDIWTK